MTLKVAPTLYTISFSSEDFSQSVIIGDKSRIAPFTKFVVPGARFSKLVRDRKWDGKKSIIKRNKLGIGLLPYMTSKMAALPGVSVRFLLDSEVVPPQEIVHRFFEGPGYSTDALELLLALLPDRYPPRDYQLDSVAAALESSRCMIILPTASGKSLIIYLLACLLLDRLGGPGLIIVPRISLVEQLERDFALFSQERISPRLSIEGRDMLNRMQNPERQLMVSTFQSWTGWYDMEGSCLPVPSFVIFDEAHMYSEGADEFARVFQKTRYRYGTTATVPETPLAKLALEGLIGPVLYTKPASELIKEGFLAVPNIHQLILKHHIPADEAPPLPNMEIGSKDHLLIRESRLRIIADIARKLPENSSLLVLSDKLVTQSNFLKDYLQTRSEFTVLSLDANSSKAERSEVIQIMNQPTGRVVLCVTYALFQMGVNIPTLTYVLLFSPSGSSIRVLQSIGRGLRKDSPCHVFDMVDQNMDDDSPRSASIRRKIYQTAYGDQYNFERMEWTC